MTNSAPDPAHYQKLKLLSRSRSPKRGRIKEKMISWFEKNYKVSLAITILIAIAMFYISSLTFGGVGEKGGTNLIAILYHILAYFFLALFFGFTLIKGKYKSFFIIVILFSIFYGITDEIHQYFVPGRSASVSDVGLDSIGIMLSTLSYLVLIEYRKKISIYKN